jgi:hypothetical protein
MWETPFTSVSGWALVFLAAATITLPYLLRRRSFGRTLRLLGAQAGPFLRRMQLHYWLGYFITGVTLAHAFVSMGAGLARNTSVLGLYLATGALFLLIGQVALGRQLRAPSMPCRREMRRLHFWTMFAIVTLAAGHIALNSPAIHWLWR